MKVAANKIEQAMQREACAQNLLRDIEGEIDRRCLQTVSVIGATPEGIASRSPTFRRLGMKVLICIEAERLSEARLLSTLLPSVQHCIQISSGTSWAIGSMFNPTACHGDY